MIISCTLFREGLSNGLRSCIGHKWQQSWYVIFETQPTLPQAPLVPRRADTMYMVLSKSSTITIIPTNIWWTHYIQSCIVIIFNLTDCIAMNFKLSPWQQTSWHFQFLLLSTKPAVDHPLRDAGRGWWSRRRHPIDDDLLIWRESSRSSKLC